MTARAERILDVAQPVITDCVENRGFKGRIAVPMTDGKRFFNPVVDIDEAYRTGCKSIVKEWHKAVLLVSIDELGKSISASSTSCAECAECVIRAEGSAGDL